MKFLSGPQDSGLDGRAPKRSEWIDFDNVLGHTCTQEDVHEVVSSRGPLHRSQTTLPPEIALARALCHIR